MKEKLKKVVKPITLNPMTSEKSKKENKNLVKPITLNPMTSA